MLVFIAKSNLSTLYEYYLVRMEFSCNNSKHIIIFILKAKPSDRLWIKMWTRSFKSMFEENQFEM